LYPKYQTILEREYMEFRPFGVDEQGKKIRDLTGMSIRATVLYLETFMTRRHGDAAGLQAVQDLCASLNGRIRNSVYHVTPAFLKNAWNSYSYEFTAYLYEFCEQISGDTQFVFRGGMEKASPIMQVLARPFSLSQIYGMFPYFGNKFASGSIECRVVAVTHRSATLAMRFSERTLRQFGSYRRRCTFVMCQAAQGIMAAVPARVHGLPPATLTECSCIANDDDWCQWDITWNAEPSDGWARRIWSRGGSRPAMPEGGSPLLSSVQMDALLPTAGLQPDAARSSSSQIARRHAVLPRLVASEASPVPTSGEQVEDRHRRVCLGLIGRRSHLRHRPFRLPFNEFRRSFAGWIDSCAGCRNLDQLAVEKGESTSGGLDSGTDQLR
jgi:hypothetical protein